MSENGRDNRDSLALGTNFCTSAIELVRSGYGVGGYYVSTFNAPAGAEFNINVAAAFFPYTNWLGGIAYNSGATNGGKNDVLIGSPGLVLGTHFIDNGGGRSVVNLKSFGINSQTDGVLLVTHDVDEALTLADRILVMRSGRIAASFQPKNHTPQALRPILLEELGVQSH